MAEYNDLIEHIELDNVKNLLEKFGIPYHETDTALIMPTLCHNTNIDDASWKLYYYKNTKMFNCFTHCGLMSFFKFLKIYYETRNIAYDWYEDVLGVISSLSSFKPKATAMNQGYQSIRGDYKIEKRKELHTYPNGLIEVYTKQYPYEWLREGITRQTMDQYNIRMAISQNRIVIPHYNPKGELVGLRGRLLDPDEAAIYGKYMPMQIEGRMYAHQLSLNLYALNWNWQNIQKYKVCFIVEGEKSCMLANNFDLPNCTVAACGSHINKYQIQLVLKYCMPNEIVICFDKDKHDFEALYKMCEKYKHYCQMSFLLDKGNLLGEKDSPTDKGAEVFKQLIKERITIK